jgi:uncharacterized membrane protein YoaK (UPF0700 family)
LAENDARAGDDAGSTSALALLSFAAGAMDALTFLMLGHIFTSAMSGNSVLLGLALGQAELGAAAKAAAAIAGYVVGVACATPLLASAGRGIGRVLVAETVLLAAFAALWGNAGGATSVPVLYALIGLSAVAMGLQGAVGRHLKLPGLATVVFTSTLTAIVGATVERLLARQRPLLTAPTGQQIAMYAAYLASAAAMGFAAARWPGALPYVPLAAVALAGIGLALRRVRP